MDHLSYCKRPYVSRLKRELESDPDRIKVYRKGAFPLDPSEALPSPLRPGGEPPALKLPSASANPQQRAATDAENAEKIHRWLPEMSEVQAADERLWVHLTHTTFMEYSRRRWPPNKVAEVVDHWFLRSPGLSGLRRNAVARLWWAAHLTASPWDRDPALAFLKAGDPLMYTRVLLSSQDLFQHLMERKYGGNLRLRVCLLAAIAPYLKKGTNMAKLSQEVTKRINLIQSYRALDSMSPNDLKAELDSLVAATAGSI